MHNSMFPAALITTRKIQEQPRYSLKTHDWVDEFGILSSHYKEDNPAISDNTCEQGDEDRTTNTPQSQ